VKVSNILEKAYSFMEIKKDSLSHTLYKKINKERKLFEENIKLFLTATFLLSPFFGS
jgi:hypothetical protein